MLTSAHLKAYLPLIGAFALAGGAAWFRSANLDPLPAADLAAIDPAQNAQAVTLYRRALQLDNGNPYRWADLGEALSNDGQPVPARAALTRAVELAPHVPAVRLRLVNFLFLTNDAPAALPHAAEVLKAVPDYDQILFSYLDNSIGEPARILQALNGQTRALRSWLLHCIGTRNLPAARLAWAHLLTHRLAPPDLAGAYLDFLLRQQEFTLASAAWANFVGPAGGEYPSRNLIFNGNFAAEPRPSPLDWRLTVDSEDFEVAREAQGLKITFLGKTNVHAEPAWQTVVLPRPGAYRLSASLQTDRLTTNEGLRLGIPDLGLTTAPFNGTNPPAEVTLDFTVPAPRIIRLAILRLPSQKFDNKIEGTAWVRNLRLLSRNSVGQPTSTSYPTGTTQSKRPLAAEKSGQL